MIRKRSCHIISVLVTVVTLVVGFSVKSQGVQENRGNSSIFFHANALYHEEKYSDAIREYRKLVDAGLRSANIFYNLGNAYLKVGEKGKAILFYERAFRMAPRDADIKSNLKFARSLVQDNTVANRKWYAKTFFFLRGFFSTNELAIIVSVLYFLTVSALILHILFRSKSRIFYYFAVGLFVALIIVLPSFADRVYADEYQKRAVIMASEVDTRFEPRADATIHFRLHEGAIIRIIKAQGHWYQIERYDGKVGWLQEGAFTVI